MIVYIAVLCSLLQGISMRGAKMLVSLSALSAGASPFQVGVLAALFAAFPLLLAVYAGKISDRIGVKHPMIFGSCVMALGLLVPLSLLPGWVGPLAWILSPTWGMRAIRDAAFGGNAWPEIGLCAGLGVVYVVLGSIALRNFERLARDRATLSLT